MSALERASLDGLEPCDRPRKAAEMPPFHYESVVDEWFGDCIKAK